MNTPFNHALEPLSTRAQQIFSADLNAVRCRTDRIFAGLMVFQWLAAVAGAVWISPLTWAGSVSSVHPHVILAAWFGGLITIVPVLLVFARPGATVTRHTVAVGQALASALLIHVSGGRIETHFHVFGSLAFLAFYRDWRVLVTASAVVGLDHCLRGVYWPESVFGVAVGSPWRWLEHVGWVAFEDLFLIQGCITALREMRGTAARQSEIERARVAVEGLVVERTTELEIARDRALCSSRAKSEFLARMSHEIRTPLNGIIGMGDLLATTSLAVDQRDHLEVMRSCSVGLHTIVNEILDYSRLEAGGMALEVLDFDVRDLLDQAVETLSAEAHRKGLELVAGLGSEVPATLRGDPTRIRQVLLNLLGNAVKFTEKGTVSVRVDVECVAGGERRLHFTVADTGIGIAPDAGRNLFEPFTQADGSMTRRFGGTGLGLAISRRIVNTMGGEIGFRSQAGKGTEFWFFMPLVVGERIARSAEELACAGKRVLVIASAAELENARAALQGLEVTLDVADRIDAGLHLYVGSCRRGTTYDCIVIDRDLPEMDGLELGRRLQGIPARRSPPLLLLSRPDEERFAVEARKAGFAGLLHKPLRRGRLIRRLASAARTETHRSAGEPAPILPVEPDATSLGSVLVAEDNPVNRKVVVKMIRKLGWSADVVEDGARAVEVLALRRYDLVLMDCQMPVMDGLDATRRIREAESGSTRHAWIVALTANALSTDRDECMRAGMDGFLAKPVTLAQLEAVLAKVPKSTPSSGAV